jgi:hypothetical protein
VRRYVVLVACDPGQGESASQALRKEHVAAHHAFEEYVDAHGRRISSAPLAGADTATTIRHVDGATTVADGSFLESVESVGGYYDVELPDLDSAIAAGLMLPSSYAVEIRPTMAIESYEGV